MTHAELGKRMEAYMQEQQAVRGEGRWYWRINPACWGALKREGVASCQLNGLLGLPVVFDGSVLSVRLEANPLTTKPIP